MSGSRAPPPPQRPPSPPPRPAAPALHTLFRPAVVSSFAPRAAGAWRVRAMHLGAYAASLAAALVMLTESFETGAGGKHALSDVQAALRGAYEAAVTGEWPAAPEAPAPAPAPAPEATAVAHAGLTAARKERLR